MAVDIAQLSREEGDGAGAQIDDKYDGEEYTTKDKRSPAATTYYETDIDSHCTDSRYAGHLRRAMKYQEGQHSQEADDDPSRASQNHEEYKRRLVGTITSQLDMNRSQKDRIEHLVLDVVSVNSFGHYSTEQVVIAVVNIVAHEDDRLVEFESDFMDMVIDVGLTTTDGNADMGRVGRLREMVRERIPSK